MYYGMGVPVRKLPAILREFTGIEVMQSALTEDVLKKPEGAVGKAYAAYRGSPSAGDLHR